MDRTYTAKEVLEMSSALFLHGYAQGKGIRLHDILPDDTIVRESFARATWLLHHHDEVCEIRDTILASEELKPKRSEEIN